MLPLKWSFKPLEQYWSSVTYLKLFDTVCEIGYIIDVTLGFFTTYLDTFSGDEIVEAKLIAIHYLKGCFTIDFLSTLPAILSPIAQTIADNDNEPVFAKFLFLRIATFLGLLRIARVGRIGNLIRQLNSIVETKALIMMNYYLFLLFLFVHVLACSLWALF
jgi:hypothetical protein